MVYAEAAGDLDPRLPACMGATQKPEEKVPQVFPAPRLHGRDVHCEVKILETPPGSPPAWARHWQTGSIRPIRRRGGIFARTAGPGCPRTADQGAGRPLTPLSGGADGDGGGVGTFGIGGMA